ncbi:MAG: methyltransferase domain-containing protein [Desulfatiglandales bacterium]
MKSLLIDFLICPACLPQEKGLACDIRERHGEDVLTGTLECDQCGAHYPILDGIASLLPRAYLHGQQDPSKYNNSTTISSYLWSHYGDLRGDKDTSTAYGEWAHLIKPDSGFSLDAGCAAGRFTFELSKRSDFSVGIDNSHPFIRTARELMKNRQLSVSMQEEGMLMKHEIISLPGTWSSDKVEFIVGDVQSLPFHSNLFPSIASLNLVDKLPFPLGHLKEMNRVAKKKNAQFLFSDPFSWSSEVAREEDWLGGTNKGPYSGRGMDNIISLLTGEKSELLPPWKIDEKGHIWWKIRNHRNHFELIRSCFIKASR